MFPNPHRRIDSFYYSSVEAQIHNNSVRSLSMETPGRLVVCIIYDGVPVTSKWPLSSLKLWSGKMSREPTVSAQQSSTDKNMELLICGAAGFSRCRVETGVFLSSFPGEEQSNPVCDPWLSDGKACHSQYNTPIFTRSCSYTLCTTLFLVS